MDGIVALIIKNGEEKEGLSEKRMKGK